MSPNDLIDAVIANTWLWFVYLTFLSYSITRLIVTDDFYIFSKPREWIKNNFPPEDWVMNKVPPHRKPDQFKKLPNNRDYVVLEGHWLGELISCPWCSGFWVSAGVWAAFLFVPEIVVALGMPLAIRALVGSIAFRNNG